MTLHPTLIKLADNRIFSNGSPHRYITILNLQIFNAFYVCDDTIMYSKFPEEIVWHKLVKMCKSLYFIQQS